MNFNFDAGKYRAFIKTDCSNAYLEEQESLSNIYTFTSTHAPSLKNTWVPVTWNNMPSAGIYGNDIWFQGKNIYYTHCDNETSASKSYKLNKETNEWEEIIWTEFPADLCGEDIWHIKSGTFFYGNRYLTKDGDAYKWEVMPYSWRYSLSSGGTSTISYVYGRYIWYNGTEVVYNIPSTWGNYAVVFPNSYSPDPFNYCWKSGYDKDYGIWQSRTRTEVADDIDGRYVWTDPYQKTIYFSKPSLSSHQQGRLRTIPYNTYSKIVWFPQTWYGDLMPDGRYVWNDGYYIYHSDGSGNNFILNKETDTWLPKYWNGYNNLDGQFIWTDRQNVYYSNGNQQYKLV